MRIWAVKCHSPFKNHFPFFSFARVKSEVSSIKWQQARGWKKRCGWESSWQRHWGNHQDCSHSWTCTEALSSPAGVCVPSLCGESRNHLPRGHCLLLIRALSELHHSQSRERKPSFLTNSAPAPEEALLHLLQCLYLQPVQILSRQLTPFSPSKLTA